MRKSLVLTLASVVVVLLAIFESYGQKMTGIAFYDVDKLHDTIPSIFYDDLDYTPSGKLTWDSRRYRDKVAQVASVVDSMAMTIVGLYGVESEDVVRDIVAAATDDYSYIHRTRNSFDGMDFALLYYGDQFFPDYTHAGRSHLYVEGLLQGRRVALLFSTNGQYIEETIENFRYERSSPPMIIMGQVEDVDAERLRLADPLARRERLGAGNVVYRNRWLLRDKMLVDVGIDILDANIYAKRYLLDPRSLVPKPTYDRMRWIGGYGRFLPVYIYVR